MNSIKSKKWNLTLILLLIFSILLALGTWNPFLSFSENIENDNVIGLSQIYSVLFIIYLFFNTPLSNKLKYFSWEKYLIALYVILLVSTLVCSINEMTLSTCLFFVKFLLSISLCFLLPKIFVRNSKYIYYSVFVFSLSCAIIAVCFTFGLLDDYVSVSKGRIFIFGENPNSTSGRIVIALVLLFFLIIRNPLKWNKKRYLLLLLFIPMLVMIIASGSRGSFIILCLCIIFFLIFNPSKNFVKKFLVLSFSLLFIGIVVMEIALYYSDFSLFARLEDSFEYGDSGGREILNYYAFQIFEDNPFIGKGIIGFVNEMFRRYDETRTVHNLYLYILATSGIVGFTAFCAFSYSLIKKSWNIRKKEHLPLVLLMFIYLLAYKTGGVLTYLLMWYLFAVIISFINLEFYERRSNSVIDRMESDKINQ